MMNHSKGIIVLAVLIVWAGCGTTKPSRFYNLTAVSGSQMSADFSATTKDIGLGIGPIKIPDSLDRPELVVRKGPNEIKVAQFDRWAGSLKEDLSCVMLENLSSLLATDLVFLYPWRGVAPIDYQIIIDIIQLDGKPGGSVTLSARWIVIKKDREEVVIMKRSKVTRSTDVGGYEGLVAAQSYALGELSHEIAEGIKGLVERGAAQ